MMEKTEHISGSSTYWLFKQPAISASINVKEIVHPCSVSDFLSLHFAPAWFAYDVWIYEIIFSFCLILC
jgi:hypothetical protein